MFIPQSWTPLGVDYGLHKQCIRTVSPAQPNFFYDNADCPGPSYPTSGYWTTAVETEATGGVPCTGVTGQSFLINGAGSPVSEAWTGNSSTGYLVNLKTDYTQIANPCAGTTFTWVPLMDNQVGGGPFPSPDHLVVQFVATFNRTLPAGSGATRAFAGAGAQWNIAAANGNPTLATFGVEIDVYLDEPQWGKQPNQPADVISNAVLSASPPSYFVVFDGSKLFPPISIQLNTTTQIVVNWGAVFQHAVDEGLFPAPINGWSNSSAFTTATYAGTEVANAVTGAGGPMVVLVVSKYEEGQF